MPYEEATCYFVAHCLREMRHWQVAEGWEGEGLSVVMTTAYFQTPDFIERGASKHDALSVLLYTTYNETFLAFGFLQVKK